MMRSIALLVLVLLPVAVACRTIVVTEAGKYGDQGFAGLRNTVNTSLADVRRSESTVTIDDRGEDQGVQIALDKFEASQQFMAMTEKVAPELLDLFQTALIAKGATAVAGSLSDLISELDEDDVPVEDITDIVTPEGE